MYEKLKIFKNRAGFTMVELMIVCIIVSLGAAVCAFSVRAVMPEIRLKAAVRDMKSDMTLAKLTAIQTGSFATIQFDLANEQYTVFRDDGAGDPAKAGDLVQDAGEPTIKTVNHPSGVDMTASGFGPNAEARFNQLGQSWGAGSVVMTNPGVTNPTGRILRVRTTLIGNLSIQTSLDGNDPWTDLNPPK